MSRFSIERENYICENIEAIGLAEQGSAFINDIRAAFEAAREVADLRAKNKIKEYGHDESYAVRAALAGNPAAERCESVGPEPERFRCGLPKGHTGNHNALMETGAPWAKGEPAREGE